MLHEQTDPPLNRGQIRRNLYSGADPDPVEQCCRISTRYNSIVGYRPGETLLLVWNLRISVADPDPVQQCC